MAAEQKRNVIVGPGRLFYSQAGTALPADTAGGSNLSAYRSDADWQEMGYTQEGVEVSYQPDYGEVEVDQLKDAAVLFNQGVNVMMNTNLVEATLENLLIAWGQPDTAIETITNDRQFKISVPTSEPVERSLAVIGRGIPRDVSGTFYQTERIYHAHRVVSMEGSNHSLRRTEATVFPVSFRLLPDSNVPGAEYGTITERLIETVTP